MMINFVNTHLSPLSMVVIDLGVEFHDGVYLIILLGIMGGYFVPLWKYKLNPESVEDKLENVRFAIRLVDEMGGDVSRIRPTGKDRGKSTFSYYFLFHFELLEHKWEWELEGRTGKTATKKQKVITHSDLKKILILSYLPIDIVRKDLKGIIRCLHTITSVQNSKETLRQ